MVEEDMGKKGKADYIKSSDVPKIQKYWWIRGPSTLLDPDLPNALISQPVI